MTESASKALSILETEMALRLQELFLQEVIKYWGINRFPTIKYVKSGKSGQETVMNDGIFCVEMDKKHFVLLRKGLYVFDTDREAGRDWRLPRFDLAQPAQPTHYIRFRREVLEAIATTNSALNGMKNDLPWPFCYVSGGYISLS